MPRVADSEEVERRAAGGTAAFGSRGPDRGPMQLDGHLADGVAEPDVGAELQRLLGAGRSQARMRQPSGAESARIAFDGVRLSIGRDRRNDVVLADPNVSAFHAEVLAVEGGLEVRDRGSRNGTRLNGEMVKRARLEPGASIGVGSTRLLFDGAGFRLLDDYGLLHLGASGLTVRVGSKEILADASLSLGTGELVAVIGESGAGKSTLLKVLAGITQPDSGRVTVDGEPLASRMTDIGYLPQDEIDHDLLSVHEALTYSARLRLPDDASDAQIGARVARVLEELALTEHAHTRVGDLSGGQRRRANVAAELLGRPSLLLLDEPTTGMDPSLESKMMMLFRELADHSRGIALVTHATKSLALCDRVVAIGAGGVLTFDGRPSDACAFFGVEDYDGIYAALEEKPPAYWRGRFAESSTVDPAGASKSAQTSPARPARRRGGRRWGRQTRVLTERYVKLLRRDTRNMLLLLVQPPVLALCGVGLFKSGVFDRPGTGPGDAIQALFLASLVMIWLGTINGVREIIKERGVFERESALGVRIGAYMASKVIVLFGLMVIQALLYSVVLFSFRPLHMSAAVYLSVFALLIATGFASVCLGLLISAAVRSENQAMTCLPLALIPQLLFTGTIVPVASMAAPAHALAAVAIGRWSLAAVGAAVEMNARMAETPGFSELTGIGTHFFTTGLAAGLLIQGAFLVVWLGSAIAVLARQARRRGER